MRVIFPVHKNVNKTIFTGYIIEFKGLKEINYKCQNLISISFVIIEI